MKLSIKQNKWKRYFSVPCALTDEYLRLADAAALKVFLYLLASESDECDESDIISATGINKSQFDDAISFWKSYGVFDTSSDNDEAAVATNSDSANDISDDEENSPHIRKIATLYSAHYNPAGIAELLIKNSDLRDLFDEAQTILGRILKHADQQLLISLKDYYGFSLMSVIAILSYCVEMDKTSAKYIESVAKGLFDKGITEFKDIEKEFERLNEILSFENKIRQAFGLSTKFTPRQISYIESWKESGFSLELITLACERCIDSTNKVSFPYIDKVLSRWADKNITTVEEANSENKPATNQRIEKTHSFDLDDFDKLTLGIKDDKN